MLIHNFIKLAMRGIKSPIIFEVGSSTGTDTKILAELPEVIIHAFEPDPRCVFEHYPPNVKINKVAVSDTEGFSKFYLSESAGYGEDNPWTFSSSILTPKNHLTVYDYVWFDKEVQVPVIKLDDYCQQNNIEHIDIIWMDVQGAEAKVFLGAENILQKTKYIYTEYSDNEMYEGQAPLKELLAILKHFEIIHLYDQEVTKNVLLKNTRYE